MDESTFLLLACLGVLAWLLAGGWPYVRDRAVADDGPLGLGAGVTAWCPGCGGPVPAPVPDEAGATRARSSLRPLPVGRDETLRLECPACGCVYTVLGVPSVVAPAPWVVAD